MDGDRGTVTFIRRSVTASRFPLRRHKLIESIRQAYLEFFASPEHLSKLLEMIEKTPAMTYHAVRSFAGLSDVLLNVEN